ncbi:maltokinase N-terminal cap-like domain-containing protein [Streptomyces orinoci]|uniref:1,4-alpha-glucan branching protein n=1 Tax=Streptomyces orinoci TaxID=67339 RepID=A0ABV3K1Y7_STRON|nr:1,4-alpha-glucan branching protein [Streptomyces orinoci]
MGIVYQTTMKPTKLEILAPWLLDRPWYLGTGRPPRLSRTGGFRLDDPLGEVGIELMVATDESGERPVSYHLPLTYRGAPLEGAEHALIGTSRHGVLGKRWVYDGTHDPVLVAQVLELLQGRAEPQARSQSNTPDPSVTSHFSGAAFPVAVRTTAVTDGPDGTELVVEPEAGERPLRVHITRVLQAGQRTPGDEARGFVTAPWSLPDGTEPRGVFLQLR